MAPRGASAAVGADVAVGRVKQVGRVRLAGLASRAAHNRAGRRSTVAQSNLVGKRPPRPVTTTAPTTVMSFDGADALTFEASGPRRT